MTKEGVEAASAALKKVKADLMKAMSGLYDARHRCPHDSIAWNHIPRAQGLIHKIETEIQKTEEYLLTQKNSLKERE